MMNFEHVPREFWISLSVTMLLLAIPFAYSVYRADGITIEIANTKISLSNQVAKLEDMNNKLRTLSLELQNSKTSLNNQLKKFDPSSETRNPSNMKEWSTVLRGMKLNINEPAISHEVFDKNAQELSDIRQAIIK